MKPQFPHKKTGLVTSSIFLEHDTGSSHPENIQRLVAIQEMLDQKSILSQVHSISPRVASLDEIQSIHSLDHIQTIQSIAGSQGYLDGDTPFSAKSSSSAFYAVGAGLTLADAMLSGQIQNGFAMVRPPGHHAEEDHAMGFCFFNNIAVTARYLQQKGLQKIAILDWDVHHGNGTQNAFYGDDSVLFISTHQYPYYPGSGSELEIGTGKGKGYNLNIPLPRGAGDSDFQKAFQNKILPSIDSFQPDAILISAGFDAHKRDPLAGLEVSTAGFEAMTRQIVDKAEEVCQGRVLSFLEGGYDLQALAESVEVHLTVLS